jgi:hypothetical protein
LSEEIQQSDQPQQQQDQEQDQQQDPTQPVEVVEDDVGAADNLVGGGRWWVHDYHPQLPGLVAISEVKKKTCCTFINTFCIVFLKV